jgi:Fur family ferric uptake transcriptional regulator
VEAIADAGRPMTTGELVAVRPTLSQSTTYRNLVLLEQAGVVDRVRGTDEYARFELSEELAVHHHHLVCVSCGNVADFLPPSAFERRLTDLIGEVTAGVGFRADKHRLDLLGTCGNCE